MRARPAIATGTEAEILRPDRLAALEAPWADLAMRALEPNPFLAPAIAMARLAHLPGGSATRLLAAWRREDGARRLVGLSLLVPPRRRTWNPVPIRRAIDLYAPLSTPLIDPDRPAETLGAMLATLADAGIRGLLLPHLAADGPVATALLEAAAEIGLPMAKLGRHERAFLASALPGEAYLDAVLERKRRKEFDRQRRRLAETGTLAFSVAAQPAAVAQALDAFIALEATGWKGRAGTALRDAPGAAAYFRQAAEAGARDGTFRVATLTLDGRPIAAGFVSLAQRRAFYVKTAYDETLARFSPGLLLTLDLTRHLLDDDAIDDADSVAVADHPMIDRIWTGRLAVETLLIGTRPGNGIRFQLALAAERGRERAIVWAKARLRR